MVSFYKESLTSFTNICQPNDKSSNRDLEKYPESFHVKNSTFTYKVQKQNICHSFIF